MKTLVKKSQARITKNQTGFTLIELLVVVAIIVALAAVIVPAVAQFSGRGEEGAASAELDTVQTAVDAMMADAVLTAVDPRDLAGFDDAVSDFAGLDFDLGLATVVLTDYMRDNPTGYQYCWDGVGNIVQLWLDVDGITTIEHPAADYDLGDRPFLSTDAPEACIS